MNLLVILEYNQNNKRPREERKRKKKEKGSRTGRAGIINDFQRKEAIINQLFGFICASYLSPISLKLPHATDGRGQHPWRCCYHKFRPPVFRILRTRADPKLILNVNMKIGVEILHHYCRHSTNHMLRLGQGSSFWFIRQEAHLCTEHFPHICNFPCSEGCSKDEVRCNTHE